MTTFSRQHFQHPFVQRQTRMHGAGSPAAKMRVGQSGRFQERMHSDAPAFGASLDEPRKARAVDRSKAFHTTVVAFSVV